MLMWGEGQTAAMLEEYERALGELSRLLYQISEPLYSAIADPNTEDPDCRSIQTVMQHVVRAGYGYATYILRQYQPDAEFRGTPHLPTVQEARDAAQEMMAFTRKVLTEHPDLVWEEYENERKMLVRWGQRYDNEQLMEHAIVHILRHRRQIEKFWAKLIMAKSAQ